MNSSISSFNDLLTKVIIPYILILGVISFLINYFFEQKVIFKSETSGSYKVNRIINQTHTAEIPIFGSSRAEGSFIPDTLGTQYYNYGIRGTLANVWLFFLEEELKKTKAPNTPIILSFDYEGLQSRIGAIHNYIPNANHPGIKEVLKEEFRPYFKLPMIRYYGNFEYYLKFYLNDRIGFSKAINKGGAFTLGALDSIAFNATIKKRKETDVYFNNEPALKKRLLQLIENNPTRNFIVVIAPYHSSFFESYKNIGEADKFLNGLSLINNCTVLNYSNLNYEDPLFYNSTHINYDGAKRFSLTLRDTLNLIL